jgi:hypothetical protein
MRSAWPAESRLSTVLETTKRGHGLATGRPSATGGREALGARPWLVGRESESHNSSPRPPGCRIAVVGLPTSPRERNRGCTKSRRRGLPRHACRDNRPRACALCRRGSPALGRGRRGRGLGSRRRRAGPRDRGAAQARLARCAVICPCGGARPARADFHREHKRPRDPRCRRRRPARRWSADPGARPNPRRPRPESHRRLQPSTDRRSRSS